MFDADLGACLHQIQLCSLSDVAGWQAQSWALQQIGIDFFAEAKEVSDLRSQNISHCCTRKPAAPDVLSYAVGCSFRHCIPCICIFMPSSA